MLSAINRSKVKLELKEDSLTSSVFDLLFYLPQDLFWKLLQDSVYGDSLKRINTGKILKIEFWPHWGAEDTEKSRFVEPDIFIGFENLDLIVEAKRMDENRQNLGQWENEIQAYKNEFGENEKNKELFLLAIGGIWSKAEKTIGNCKIIKCNWTSLLDEVKQTRKSLVESKEISNFIDSTVRILDGIILAFQLHGYFTGEWFEKFPIEEDYKINNYNNSIKIFRTKFN